MLDQARSAQGKSRGQSRIGLVQRWPHLIEHDITRGTAFFSPRISMMVLCFFVQGSRKHAQWEMMEVSVNMKLTIRDRRCRNFCTPKFGKLTVCKTGKSSNVRSLALLIDDFVNGGWARTHIGAQHTNWSGVDPPFWKWWTDPRSICMLGGGGGGLVRHLQKKIV